MGGKETFAAGANAAWPFAGYGPWLKARVRIGSSAIGGIEFRLASSGSASINLKAVSTVLALQPTIDGR